MQSLVQEFPQRVFRIFEKQTVVAERRHGDGDLSKIVEVLQHWTLQKNQHAQGTSAREGRGETFSSGGQGSVQLPSQAEPRPKPGDSDPLSFPDLCALIPTAHAVPP